MNNTLKMIKADIKANKGNYEVILFLITFRLSGFLKQSLKRYKFGLLLFPIYLLMRIFYKILSTIYLMEIPVETKIGGGLIIYHLKGTVINVDASIGKNVTINHFITIADTVDIADGVVINPLSVIIKGNIGENAVVGAGSVVTKDVAENMIVAGSPAKVIGKVDV
ncbi:MAG TPA: serine acetyltransferase [Leucothrix sp.]|nr:serine acetyltransferase [Leucothrix sp.]